MGCELDICTCISSRRTGFLGFDRGNGISKKSVSGFGLNLQRDRDSVVEFEEEETA